MNCYTYLEEYRFQIIWNLKPIIYTENEINKVRKALYSIKGFLKNPHTPIPLSYIKNVIFQL